jgi:hypothetical protein
MIENLVALLCVCGHAMSVLLRGKDKHMCTLDFFDNDPSSASFGERVIECPGCGERLGLHRLTGRA